MVHPVIITKGMVRDLEDIRQEQGKRSKAILHY